MQTFQRFLVTSSRDRKIQVWDTASWRLLDTMILPLSGGLKSKNRGKRYNGGRSITNSQSERLWLTVEFAPIEFNDKIDNVGILSSSYMGEILLWPWRWQGERKYGQASVSSDTTVHPRCLVDNKKAIQPDTIARCSTYWLDEADLAPTSTATRGGLIFLL